MAAAHSLPLFFVSLLFVMGGPSASGQTPKTEPPSKPKPEVQMLLDAGQKALDAKQYPRAQQQFEAALAKARALQDKRGQADSLIKLGKACSGASQWNQAIEDFSQALALYHTLDLKSQEAGALSSIGVAYYRAGQPLKAVEYWRQAAAIDKALGDKTSEAGMLGNVGIVYDNTGQVKKALEIYLQILPIFTATGDKQSQAAALTNIGISYNKLGEQKQSLEYFLRALPLWRTTGDKSQEANVLNFIGGYYLNTGQPSKALDYYQQALTLYKADRNPAGEGEVFVDLAELYEQIGRPEKAIELNHQALALARSVDDKRSQGHILNNLAILESKQGETQQALADYQQALLLYRALNDKSEEGSVLLNIGFIEDQTDQPQAADYFQQALTISRATGDRRTEASALAGLGTIAQRHLHWQEALENKQKALALFQALSDKEDQANLLGNIGNVYYLSKRSKQARVYFKKALSLFTSVGDKNGQAAMLNSLGLIYRGAGKRAEAAAAFHKAVQFARDVGNRDYEAATLYDLGRLEQQQGRLAASEADLQRSVALTETIRTNFGGFSEAKSAFLGANIDRYTAYLNLLILRHKTEQAFAVAQKTKARALLDLLATGRVDLSGGLTTEERTQEQGLRRQADGLNLAMVKEGVQNEAGAKKRFEALKGRLEEVERQLQIFTETLYARHPELARKRIARTANLKDVAKFLPADTVLLDYVVVSDEKVLLFATTARQGTAQAAAYSLPIKAKDLEQLTAAFHAACADPHKDYRAASRRLAALLIAPAAGRLAGKRRLVICPDGPLWDVPFQALLTGKRFLAERYEIDYSYSATGAEAALSRRDDKRVRPAGTLLVFANPEFGSVQRFDALQDLPGRPLDAPSRPLDAPSRPLDAPSRPLDAPSRPLDAPSRPLDAPSRPLDAPSRPLDAPSRPLDAPTRALLLRGGGIAPLPGTQREADALKRDFPDAVVYTGAEAQETEAKAKMPGFRYLHFATHGFFNDAAPMLSCIVLAQPKSGDPDDGFLTAREIFDMKLNTDLVTLSACNTARGVSRGGEGMIGLTWALSVAGAPTQVVSMWSVDDRETAQLMERFYAGLTRRRQGKGEALRQAALTVMHSKQYAHPYFRAPFILLGDWRR